MLPPMLQASPCIPESVDADGIGVYCAQSLLLTRYCQYLLPVSVAGTCLGLPACLLLLLLTVCYTSLPLMLFDM